MNNQPPAKRQCVRRRRVARATVSRVPAETWIVICANLYFSPHTVFRLMMACKHVWSSIRTDTEWWACFYKRVMLYQECLNHSNIRDRLKRYTGTIGLSHMEALRLVCSPRCSLCGARYGHFVFRPLRSRVCSTCLSSQLVSNRVLASRYGIDVADFIARYRAEGGMMLPLQPYRTRYGSSKMLRLSTDPIDHIDYMPILFLLRRDVERVLSVRLEPDALVAQRARRRAGECLTSCIKRLYTRGKISHALLTLGRGYRQHKVHAVYEDLAVNELRRKVNPIAPAHDFVAGGPMCAYTGRSNVPQKRRPQFTAIDAHVAMKEMQGYSIMSFHAERLWS